MLRGAPARHHGSDGGFQIGGIGFATARLRSGHCCISSCSMVGVP
jgi:hypothetical protein